MSDDSQQQRADTMIDAALARLGATPMSEAFAEGLQARLDEERRRMARARRNRRWLAAAAAVLLCAIVGQQTWREHTRHAQAAQMAKLAAQRQIALAQRNARAAQQQGAEQLSARMNTATVRGRTRQSVKIAQAAPPPQADYAQNREHQLELLRRYIEQTPLSELQAVARMQEEERAKREKDFAQSQEPGRPMDEERISR